MGIDSIQYLCVYILDIIGSIQYIFHSFTDMCCRYHGFQSIIKPRYIQILHMTLDIALHSAIHVIIQYAYHVTYHKNVTLPIIDHILYT